MSRTLEILKALADGNRLRVMAALLQTDELCACQLIELLGVSGATTSRHLELLSRAGLVSGRKSGRWVYFRLGPALGEQPQLREWLEAALTTDRESREDRRSLLAILRVKPEKISTRQRQERCC